MFFKNKSGFFRGNVLSMRVGGHGDTLSDKREAIKFAFVASGPVKRGATLRNLLRRRMNEIIRTNLKNTKTQNNSLNIVFFYKIKNGAKSKDLPSYKFLKDDMMELLRAAKIFK